MLTSHKSSDYRGYVLVANYVDGVRVGPRLVGSNLRTVEGNEVLSRLVAGDIRYKIAGIYFEFENNAGTPDPVAFDKTTRASDFHNLVAPRDYVRAGLVSAPSLSTGDSLGTGDALSDNRASFFALATSSVGENGLDFTAAANSKIISVGLVAMPFDDASNDLLYARYALPTAFPKVAGQNPGVTWTAEFLTP